MRSNCGICTASETLTHYEVREMMFGTGEPFPYFQCGSCGCLQLAEVPDDLSRFYPDQYYAYSTHHSQSRGVRGRLRWERNRYAFFRRGLVGGILAAVAPYPHGGAHAWLSRNGLSRSARILDVGCGSGMLLHDLGAQGYRNLLGADPFIEREISFEGGRILKAPIQEVQGEFDLIMFHHSLEHMPDQVGVLEAARARLAPDGECLVRIPIVSSFAWEHYREHWVQIDAPRHLFIHSIESMRLAAQAAGLEVVEIQYDSTELQFVGSELYRRGLPLSARDANFSRREVRAYQKQAERLNKAGRGDSAAFFLRRASAPYANPATPQRHAT